MKKLLKAGCILALLLLSGCGATLTKETPPAPKATMSFPYSDQQALVLARRLRILPTPTKATPSTSVLEQIGINVQNLTVLTRDVGNCTDLTVYDLSPSYELKVDNNACFGVSVNVEKKPAADK